MIAIKLDSMNRAIEEENAIMEKRYRRLKDTMELNKMVSMMAYRDVIEHFDLEQGPDGRWKKLEMSTIESRKHGGSKPLQDTGRLKRSIRFRGTLTEAHVYTTLSYAGPHQFGAKIPDRKAKGKKPMPIHDGRGNLFFRRFAKGFTLPSRPFLWISKSLREKLGGSILSYVIKV